MNKQRLTVLIITGIGALATFMPWVKAPIVGSMSGVQGVGWITLALFTFAFLLTLLNDWTKKIKGTVLLMTVIPAIAAAAIGIQQIISLSTQSSGSKTDYFTKAIESSVSIDFGLYLLVIAGIATPILAFLVDDKEKGNETDKEIDKEKDTVKSKSAKMSKKVRLASIGALIGIPLSFYFQSGIVKIGGLGSYFKHFDQVIKNSSLLGNVVLSVAIFAIVGGVIGYFMDESERKKAN